MLFFSFLHKNTQSLYSLAGITLNVPTVNVITLISMFRKVFDRFIPYYTQQGDPQMIYIAFLYGGAVSFVTDSLQEILKHIRKSPCHRIEIWRGNEKRSCHYMY